MRCLRLSFSIALSPLIFLTNCGYWTDGWNSTVAAQPLVSVDKLTNDPQYQPHSALELTGDALTAYWISEAILDSENKCNAFLSRLTTGENTSGALLDTTSVTAGALGAVFTPMATIHILSATAAIATGTRSALSNDLYGNASVANFAQAIQTTYYSGLGTYISYLNNAYTNKMPLNLPGELARLNAIHAECALGSAEASINAALKAGNKSTNSAPTAETTTTGSSSEGGTPQPQIFIPGTFP